MQPSAPPSPPQSTPQRTAKRPVGEDSTGYRRPQVVVATAALVVSVMALLISIASWQTARRSAAAAEKQARLREEETSTTLQWALDGNKVRVTNAGRPVTVEGVSVEYVMRLLSEPEAGPVYITHHDVRHADDLNVTLPHRFDRFGNLLVRLHMHSHILAAFPSERTESPAPAEDLRQVSGTYYDADGARFVDPVARRSILTTGSLWIISAEGRLLVREDVRATPRRLTLRLSTGEVVSTDVPPRLK